MEVILKQDVEHLGFANDLVKVRDGYARNFLLPRGLAVSATSSEKKQLTETLKQRAHKEAKIRTEAVHLPEKKATLSPMNLGMVTSESSLRVPVACGSEREAP